MKIPPNAWPNTDASSGTLFVAQLLQEMLEDNTFESFRAFSLDTPIRLAEGIAVLRDIRRNRIKQQAFDPIKDELLWSLKKDPVAEALIMEHISLFEQDASSNKTSLDTYNKHLTTFRRVLIPRYKEECEKRILELFANKGRRIELRQVVGFYCSHLLNSGYSKSYLLRKVNDTFFARPIKRAGRKSLVGFFHGITAKNRKFVVYAAVDPGCASFMGKLDLGKIYSQLGDVPNEIAPRLGAALPLAQGQSYAAMDAECKDEDSAVALTLMMLSSIRALAMLVPNVSFGEWHKSMYVLKARSAEGVLLDTRALPLNRGPVRRAIGAVDYAKKILSNFDQRSTNRMLGCLRTSSLARSSTSIENQLISLWSAIEVLLSEPPENVPRIVHYIDLLLPLVCLRYSRRHFIAVYDGLLLAYRRKFKELLKQEAVMVDVDHHTRFAALICLT